MTISNVLDWIKKHVLQTILIGLTAFFLPLILVHVAYKINSVSPWFASTWNSGELIAYIAGFEAFLGTVALGIATVYLNEKSNQMNERMLNNEEKHQKFERQPNICVIGNTVSIQSLSSIFNHVGPVYGYNNIKNKSGYPSRYWRKEYYLFSWKIQNTSNKPITVKLTSLVIDIPDDQNRIIFDISTINLISSIQYIPPQSNTGVGFIMEKQSLRRNRIHSGNMELEVLNEAGESYTYLLLFLIGATNDNGFTMLKSVDNMISTDKVNK